MAYTTRPALLPSDFGFPTSSPAAQSTAPKEKPAETKEKPKKPKKKAPATKEASKTGAGAKTKRVLPWKQ